MTSDSTFEGRSLRSVPRVAVGWSMTMASLLLLVGGAPLALGQSLTTNSVEQGATPMDQVDLANPEPEQTLVPAPVEPEKKFPFFDDSKISAQLRTFYFNRDKYDDSNSEAWALGGSLSYQSGYLADVFRAGAVAYTSQPLYAPDDRDGTLLLTPGQEGYTVLGQIYGEFKFTDRLAGAFGRKEYNTPYINKNDTRMTPNTFEGVSLYGKSGGKDGAPEWRYGGGYITKIKERNSDEFVSMSVDAGASVERGVYVAGANYLKKEFTIGAANYYSDDIINIFYTEAKYVPSLSEGTKLKLAAQFSDQQSTGDDLLTGTAFSTHQWGVKADLDLGAALLTLAYTDTADGATMRNPWSGYPGYTSVQVQDFFRAGESAVMLKAAYDFSRHGLKGTSAYALWVHGSGVEAPAYNEDEVDLNLQWVPDKGGSLRGMSFRLRYANVSQRGGGDPEINDFRFIVNYDFPRP
ncbi:MAG: OprD family outer membrane porin [Betaproteobacteria bacterium]